MEQHEVEWLMAPDAPDVEGILSDLVHRRAWHRGANCKGASTDLFFPERRQSTEHAKAICAGCDVQEECLGAALADVTAQGIWAAKSERGRRELRKQVA